MSRDLQPGSSNFFHAFILDVMSTPTSLEELWTATCKPAAVAWPAPPSLALKKKKKSPDLEDLLTYVKRVIVDQGWTCEIPS